MRRDNVLVSVDYHGYTGEITCSYKNGTLTKSNEYANWYRNFPIYELPTREEWELCDVDFNKPIAIDSVYIAVEDAKVADMMTGLTQLLKDLLDIPTGKVNRCACKVVGTCEDIEDGVIMFTIYNI
jgi:hypothetical protein